MSKQRGSRSGQENPPGPALDRRLRRNAGTVYSFTDQLFEIVDELSRLFPDREPVVDFSSIVPGLESVELVSVQLLNSFARTLDQSVFLVLCRLNAPRIRDYLLRRIGDEAWPLSPDEILAEVYLQLHQFHSRRVEEGWLQPDGPFAKPLTSSRTLYHALVEAAELVMRERVRRIESMALPLPGLPRIPTSPPRFAVEATARLVEDHGWTLSEEELEGWATYALLRMERVGRKILYLREVAGRTLSEAAAELGCSSFEAGRLHKDANERLQREIARLIRSFSANALPLEDQGTPGAPIGGEDRKQPEDELGEDDD